MHQNRRISISVPFSESDRKNGAFQKLARDLFFNGKVTEIEILRFWDISKN